MTEQPIYIQFIIFFYTYILFFVREVEVRLTSLRQLKRSVPRVVNSNEFRFSTRLRVRLGFNEKKGNLFLGHCKPHKTYFLDHKHTNGDIRCPICDKAWLKKIKRDSARAIALFG